jgi:hypothetical protein
MIGTSSSSNNRKKKPPKMGMAIPKSEKDSNVNR